MPQTNFSDRPVRRRGTRHNSELENAIVKAPPTRRSKAAIVPIIEPGNGGWLEAPAERIEHIVITPPRFAMATIAIEGRSPYVQHNFSEKARKIMEERMAAGTRGKNISRTKVARDFNAEYLAAAHVMANGHYGIPAPAFRNAMITACSLVGYAMTKAKMTIFVLPDGYDRESGQPLVEIYGTPVVKESAVRIQNTTSSVWRPMWEKWTAVVRVEWDLDQFQQADVLNLMARAGRQVGVGEGRPASPKSAGLGWGLWDVQARLEQ